MGLSFKDASSLAKQIAGQQESVIAFIAELKETVTKTHKLRGTLNLTLVAFDKARAVFEVRKNGEILMEHININW